MGAMKDAFEKAVESAEKSINSFNENAVSIIKEMEQRKKNSSGNNDDDGQPQKEKTHADDIRRFRERQKMAETVAQGIISDEDDKLSFT